MNARGQIFLMVYSRQRFGEKFEKYFPFLARGLRVPAAKKVKVLFFVCPFLKSKGGAEKIILSLVNHFASKYCIFMLPEDSKREMEVSFYDKK